jgi:hypothetical protein
MQDRRQRCVGPKHDRFPACSRQIYGAAWATHLVGNHTQLLSFTVKTQHREGEIMTDWTYNPACAKNDPLGVVETEGLVDGLFTSGLTCSIHTQGSRGLVDSVWKTLLSIKDKIGAHLEEPAPLAIEFLCKGFRCSGIDGMGQLGFGLRPIDSGVSPCVENPIRSILLDG